MLIPPKFRETIRAAGMPPPDCMEPGRFYRIPGRGKADRNRAGWCILFEDGGGGSYGDFSSGLQGNWHSGKSSSPNAVFRRNAAEARQGAQDLLYREAAQQAVTVWEKCSNAPDNHPYLARKLIRSYGARLDRRRLVIPIFNFENDLTSLQFISPAGGKRFFPGGRVGGCFVHVNGDMDDPDMVVICEGFATACTLADDETDAVVLAALNASNLLPVAVDARLRWPNTELVIAGDDDRAKPDNIGATLARHAAVAADALIVLPDWPEKAPKGLSDFNDLAKWLWQTEQRKQGGL